MHIPRLTLWGRSLLLITGEVLANCVCWVVAGILFGRRGDTQLLSLALLAWSLGLRHGLDADHISAIDNATRGLLNMDQRPVTCGLFFSLGHSTIVVIVNIAIAISTDVYNKLEGVGRVGGIVGAAVSGSFLFVVGLANSLILWRILAKRRKDKDTQEPRLSGEGNSPEHQHDSKHNHMFMMRILGPVITFVDRPWKMYPVGVLFGFGFDTASSIALLAVSAIAKKGSDEKSIPSGYVVILPLLFTAGMTLVDSCDSVLMLYSYASFSEHSWTIYERRPAARSDLNSIEAADPTSTVESETVRPFQDAFPAKSMSDPCAKNEGNDTVGAEQEAKITRDQRAKMNVLSGLSITLTMISILVAFAISLITIMGLIGENCAKCRDAADNGNGLAGKWWRGWRNANDNSGYVGAAIVGSFVLVVSGWYAGRLAVRKVRARKADLPAEP